MAKSEKPVKISSIIKARRNSVLDRRAWLGLLLRIALLALIFYLLFSQVFIFCQLEGNGMYPALKDGDLMIGYRLQKDIKKNDVVIFSLDGKNCAGRVAARPGDRIDVDESGRVYINDVIEGGEILYPTFPRNEEDFPLTVPEGHVYILCDYRTQSTDSRDFGPLPLDDIQGKLISILRRRGL